MTLIISLAFIPIYPVNRSVFYEHYKKMQNQSNTYIKSCAKSLVIPADITWALTSESIDVSLASKVDKTAHVFKKKVSHENSAQDANKPKIPFDVSTQAICKSALRFVLSQSLYFAANQASNRLPTFTELDKTANFFRTEFNTALAQSDLPPETHQKIAEEFHKLTNFSRNQSIKDTIQHVTEKAVHSTLITTYLENQTFLNSINALVQKGILFYKQNSALSTTVGGAVALAAAVSIAKGKIDTIKSHATDIRDIIKGVQGSTRVSLPLQLYTPCYSIYQEITDIDPASLTYSFPFSKPKNQ